MLCKNNSNFLNCVILLQGENLKDKKEIILYEISFKINIHINGKIEIESVIG